MDIIIDSTGIEYVAVEDILAHLDLSGQIRFDGSIVTDTVVVRTLISKLLPSLVSSPVPPDACRVGHDPRLYRWELGRTQGHGITIAPKPNDSPDPATRPV